VEELQNVVVGLRRTGRLAEALIAARDAAADQAKQAIRYEGHDEQDLAPGLHSNTVVCSQALNGRCSPGQQMRPVLESVR